MPILQVIGVPAGVNVYAIISDKATGLAYSPSYLDFRPVEHQYCGINLGESPAASRWHSAPWPDGLPDGVYNVTYFQLVTMALPSDEPIGSEEITLGNDSSFSIAVQPITSEPVSPKVHDGFVEVYQSTANVIAFANLVDAAGNAVDLAGKDLRFIVYSKCGTHFQIDDGGEPNLITVDMSAGTTVSVQISSTQTDRIMEANYVLRSLTDEIVLTSGEFYVTRAPVGDE
ncbi:MAG TPA: hypothetical protein VF595_05910 [Tepidisphaeraceae bacterium]|jgi:hypothetical protein